MEKWICLSVFDNFKEQKAENGEDFRRINAKLIQEKRVKWKSNFFDVSLKGHDNT